MAARTPLRPKHVPRRTCVGCGTIDAKRSLVRVVRAPAGEILPDPTGKKPGRGAYLCSDPQCWEQAIKKGRLARALNVRLSPEAIDALRSFAHDLGLTAEVSS